MTIVHLGNTALLLEQQMVRRGDAAVRLTPLEVRLLRHLVAHSGRAVPRRELLDSVWGYSPRVRTRAVDHAVARLRKKIEEDPSDPRWLLSSWGTGYRLEWPGSCLGPSRHPWRSSMSEDSLRDNIDLSTGEAEVTARWVADHRGNCRLVDIREPHELEGPLGRLPDVENIPMLELLSPSTQLDPKQPLVLICRSGRRSGTVARLLREAGIEQVASVEGGMIAWRLEVDGNESILSDERAANTHNLGEAIYRTNGLPEVSARWVADNVGRFRLIDVRQENELRSHGRVAQSENIPLEVFMAEANTIDRSAPMVVMCASGNRSGRVVRALESAGFTAVASLEGGIFGWKAHGLPYA